MLVLVDTALTDPRFFWGEMAAAFANVTPWTFGEDGAVLAVPSPDVLDPTILTRIGWVVTLCWTPTRGSS